MSANANSGLLAALLAVQAEVPTLVKDATNPHFHSKFTPLDTVVETVGPILNKHGLVWTTLPTTDDHGRPALTYRLIHSQTSQSIEGTMPLLLSKEDSQGLGSAITYARRYSICAVLNLVADDDDDGNAASPDLSRRASSDGKPTDAQMRKLAYEVKQHKPPESTVAAMMLSVGADDVTRDDITSGAWAQKLSRRQVSGLLDVFASGVLPTGQSDIPNDFDSAEQDQATPVGGSDLPWEPGP